MPSRSRSGDDALRQFGERYLAGGPEGPIPPTKPPRLGAGASAPSAPEAPTIEIDRERVASAAERAPRRSREGDPLLDVRALRSGYGEVPVLHDISFAVYPGETAVLLGLNGAGKSTTALNLIGQLRAWSGTITFDGRDATAWDTRRAVHEGIIMVPEGRRVFPDLSVARNLEVGAWSQRREGGWLEEQRERVYGYFPRLRERSTQLAGTLSGGEQQMLAIGRGLMGRPKLLIIDEASLGLAPVIVKDVFEIVSHINDDGTTVILIEQNVGALEVADIALVMEQGNIVAEIRGDDLDDPSTVRKYFLG